MSWLIEALKPLVPYGLARRRRVREQENDKARVIQQRVLDRARKREEFRGLAEPANRSPFEYHRALALLDELGIDPIQTREGSIPAASLEFLRRYLGRLGGEEPVIALHIGNFLGISLAFMASAVAVLHSESKIVSIDPNVAHRGIVRPLQAVQTLLSHFGLEDRVAILTGYSLEKNVSSAPRSEWRNENACTYQLDLLAKLAASKFDLCLIDGNHDPDYLRRELEVVRQLLRPGGLLVLDDVDQWWPEVQAVYAAIAPDKFKKLGADGRIGVLMRT